MKNTIKAIAVAAVLTTSGQIANASEWKIGTLLAEGAEANTPTDGLYILAENEEGPAIMLGCSARLGIQAKLFLDGMTTENLTLNKIKRASTRQIEIDTESTEARKFPWAYIRPKRELISVRPWQGKRIFNAAVRGELISMSIARIGDIEITLPELNDAFTEFASSCEATAPKSKPVDSEASDEA